MSEEIIDGFDVSDTALQKSISEAWSPESLEKLAENAGDNPTARKMRESRMSIREAKRVVQSR